MKIKIILPVKNIKYFSILKLQHREYNKLKKKVVIVKEILLSNYISNKMILMILCVMRI